MVVLLIIGSILLGLVGVFVAIAILSVLLGTAASLDTEIEWEE